MYCKYCGKKINENEEICSECSKNINNTVNNYEQKSKLIAGLLGIFLGSLGIHNFYLGYNNKAVAQLLITIIGSFITCGTAAVATAIWGFIEGILILTGNINTDANGIDLKD